MIKIEHVETFGWETAVRGLRNPLNSWERADSSSLKDYEGYSIGYMVGSDDKRLMKSLVKAGTDHSKFMRMIGIGMDITSHQVWWAEFDTYKVGTVRNSCSKMHTIHIKSFEPDDFSHEGIDEVGGGGRRNCFCAYWWSLRHCVSCSTRPKSVNIGARLSSCCRADIICGQR